MNRNVFFMRILFAITLFLSSFNLFAQAEDYEKLHLLYVEEDWEKLLFKAEKAIDKDKKDPIPYIYESIALFEISQDPTTYDDEKFEDAFKNCIKFATKFVKKDKVDEYGLGNGNFIENYLNKLQGVLNEDLRNFYTDPSDIKSYKKGYLINKSYLKVFEGNPGALFLKAMAEEITGRTTDYEATILEAYGSLEGVNYDDMRSKDQDMFLYGVLHFAEYKNNTGARGEAKKLLEQTKKFFNDDEEFKDVYKAIVN